MSEWTWMRITVGGKIKAKDIIHLLNEVESEINERIGSESKAEFLKEAGKDGLVSWEGSTNYGECDDLKAWLEEHDIPYNHTCAASGEYDGSIKWWRPGMEETKTAITDAGGDVSVRADRIRPLLDLLMDYAGNPANLALHIADKDGQVRDLVSKGLKDQSAFLPELRKALDMEIPVVPDLPKIKIVRER